MIQPFPKHLYIHWPFCSSKCHFCDFVAFEQHHNFQEQYHQTLCAEIINFSQRFPATTDKSIETIFLGGGTPSLYPLNLLSELFETIRQYYNTSSVKEISIEANPADIDEEKLDVWRDLGITRLSVGVQALNDDILLKLNRRQRITDVLRMVQIAPKYFDIISTDFILGLPGISSEQWLETIKQAVAWSIRHISIYFLTIHEKTPLYFSVNRGEVSLSQDDTLVAMYENTVALLESHNFKQYEISNFSLPGYHSIHNQAYWDRKPYQGFGVGASSFDGMYRSSNDNNLSRYLECGANPALNGHLLSEKLTTEQELLELLMLGLRQKKGVDLQRVVYFLNDCQIKKFKQNLKLLIDIDLIEVHQNIIRLTLRGMALENEIVMRLLSF